MAVITYRSLARTPAAFRSLTGLAVSEAEAVCREFICAEAEARARDPLRGQTRQRRRRAPGAGAKYHLDASTRVLMARVWPKLYPTWAVLGYLFLLEETNARRDTREVLSRLERRASFPRDGNAGTGGKAEPAKPRRKSKHGRSLAKIFEQRPEVKLLVDAKEQRTCRPTGWEA